MMKVRNRAMGSSSVHRPRRLSATWDPKAEQCLLVGTGPFDAWFPANVDSKPLGTSALYGADGKLTGLGKCYRDS